MKLYVEVTLRLNIHFKSGQGFFLSRVGKSKEKKTEQWDTKEEKNPEKKDWGLSGI